MIPLCDPTGGKLILRPSLSYNKLLHWNYVKHHGALGTKAFALKIRQAEIYWPKNLHRDVMYGFSDLVWWRHSRHLQKPTCYIHHTNHSTRIPFLPTTQLQTIKESNSKTITPKSTNLTTTVSQTTTNTTSIATRKRKDPFQITKSLN